MVRVMSTPTVQSVESPDSGQARIPEAERILIESNVSPEISSNQEENVSSSDDNVCSSDTTLPNGIDQQTCGLVTSIRISNSVSNTSSLPNGIRHESSESATCSGVSTSISSDTVSSYPNCSEIRNRHRRRHSSGEQVLAERRRSRNSLQMPDSPRWDWSNHNHFRSHPFEGQENSEIANEGRDLFLGFVQNELERNHLQVPECLTPENTQEDVSLVSQSLAHNNLIAYGRDLRRMADDFAQSEQRRRLRIRAEQMQIESLDVDNFTQILIGLFEEGGVTWERVLVLFFFCSDVAIVALRRKIDQYFHKLIEWSLRFIMSKVSAWVQQNGGWAAVLSQSMNMLYRTAIIGFCAVGIVAMALYIKNNWK